MNDKNVKKNEHLCFSKRVKLQFCFDYRYDCSAELLSERLNVSRWTIYYEINNRTTLRTKDVIFNHSSAYHCQLLDKFPFVCNGCPKTSCSHRRYIYDVYEANDRALK